MLEHSEQINEIAKALATAGPELKNPKKGRTVEVTTLKGGKYSYKYAELDAILEQVKPVLAKNEIALIQSAANIPQGIRVTTMLVHSSGQFFSSDLDMPVNNDGRMNGSQAAGSAITYGRRYAISAMLGIAADEDDDAQTANDHPKAPARPTTAPAPTAPAGPKFFPATTVQRNKLLELADKANGWTKEQLSAYIMKKFELKDTRDFSVAQANALIKGFEEKIKKAQETEDQLIHNTEETKPGEEITSEMVDQNIDPTISGPVLDTDSDEVKRLKVENNKKNAGAI